MDYDNTEIDVPETPEKIQNTKWHLQNALEELNKAMKAITLVTPYYKQTKQWQELYDEIEQTAKQVQESIDNQILIH